jgi:hypothetical protein
VSRWFLGIGPALLLVSCAAAFAQDAGAAGPAATTSTGMPSADFLLSLGPYGALVWGAYLLGKGVRITIQVELSEHDRELIEKLGKGGA